MTDYKKINKDRKQDQETDMDEIRKKHALARELWETGLKDGFRVIFREVGSKGWIDNVHYNWAREISNSRLRKAPIAVAFPEDAQQVSTCLNFCREKGIPFRVRSGGHQHEGMSTVEDGVIIRMSEMDRIEYTDDSFERAWIPVGKPLKDIYDELQLQGKTIPGGGCWEVNVGGLTLGGGWGTSCRKMGLTCDNFDEAEVVLANGDVVRASANGKYSDLFWALRGGGGGNFGIVTRFLFRLSNIGRYVTTFRMQWKNMDDMKKVIETYMNMQHTFPRELTASLSARVKHAHIPKDDYFPLGMSGKYYGRKNDLIDFLSEFRSKVPKPSGQPVFTEQVFEEFGSGDSTSPGGDMVLLSQLINQLQDHLVHSHDGEEPSKPINDRSNKTGAYRKKQPPGVTCLSPHPHKISSGFPRGKESYGAIAEKLMNIVKEGYEQQYAGVRLFIVIHAMPGPAFGIKPADSAFYYRDSDFLLQFQSWWSDPGFGSKKTFEEEWKEYDENQKRYIQWIDDSREAMKEELTGAFLNFVDKNLPLEAYYGGNLARLKEIKRKYDGHNLFSFPLSIPPA